MPSKPCSSRPRCRPTRRRRRGLGAFYWHYARQARQLVVALFVAGSIVALLDTTIPVFIGRMVALVSSHEPGDAAARRPGRSSLGMAVVLLLLRPAAIAIQHLVTNQAINPGLTNLIRWQSHWHVVRQSWTFFQNDFAGRIANRVMQTGPSLRESVVSGTNAVWYILVYGSSAIVLLASSDVRLAVPMLLWFAGYAVRAALFRAAHARALAADVGGALDADRAASSTATPTS